MKISFLIHTIYGIGGTIRTTLNLAEELAAEHEIEIVSVFRHRNVPLFDIDPRITVVPLVDTRPGSPAQEKDHPEHRTPAVLFPRSEARYEEYSALTDRRVREHYAASTADVVIGTRPGLVVYAARCAPPGAVVIGQEHMSHNHHSEALREEMRPHLAALDAFVTVSEGDAAVWRARMPLPDTRVLAIPNSVPRPVVAPSALTAPVVVAAGRLSREKQYEVLIRAFAKVVAEHPEWTLRICGSGAEKDRLRRCVQKHLMSNHVLLMGPRSPIDPEWVKGSVAVSTSRHESFGMTLVEAMRNGLPVVSTDCDYGPREILKDGEDGLLTPVGKADAVAAALLTLIEDEGLRRKMGAAAARNSRRFDPSAVARRYADLFAELGAGDRASASPLPEGSGTGSGTGTGGGTAPDAVFEPVADCVAEDDGSLTVTLVTPPDAVLTHPGLRLVCVRTGGSGAADERIYPFRPDGTATVPAGDEFAEGQWLCTADRPGGGRRTVLLSRSVDQRGSLLAPGRLVPGSGVRHRVPHRRGPRHQLALRSWVRPVHAEAGDISRSGTRLTLRGRLLGPALPAGRPELVLRRRGGPEEEIVLPADREGPHGFLAVIDGETPAARQLTPNDVWEVWLRPAPGREPVRVARLLDDVVDKSGVFVYPDALTHKRRPLLLPRRVLRRLFGRPQRLVKVSLGYEGDNGLVLRLTDRPTDRSAKR
ncbi:glycosyl transferase family 1 [Streptomyces inusitatus]|uniref:D-inositol 3-phosphate glycosyltransferase n=1 Tax=Streptomyces inusitatus TaxID=68221 RepID=A0A918Q0C1_9ACTN|nr:glycosyltransferase family 4 protein [Streptomyces inusitatus]GGZ27407.1 glycosyl transferase family 1 [Streptomyces inusitatus]